MAIAAASSCWFSVVTSTGTSRYSLTSPRFFATSRRTTRLFAPTTYANHNENQNQTKRVPKRSPSSPRKSAEENSGFGEAEDGQSGRKKTERSQSTAFKSFAVQSEGNRGLIFDLKEKQVEKNNLHDAAFLNAVVKAYTM